MLVVPQSLLLRPTSNVQGAGGRAWVVPARNPGPAHHQRPHLRHIVCSTTQTQSSAVAPPPPSKTHSNGHASPQQLVSAPSSNGHSSHYPQGLQGNGPALLSTPNGTPLNGHLHSNGSGMQGYAPGGVPPAAGATQVQVLEPPKTPPQPAPPASTAAQPLQRAAQAATQPAKPSGAVSSGSSTIATPGSSYWELLNNPEQEATIFGARARSATDANVLRRKGHLKEQDYLIDYMRRMHETHTCEEVMMKMERWIAEHRQDSRRSRLRRLVPQLGNFFTSLRLVDAFKEYDSVFALSKRKYIPPNFAELRHIVNIAQVHASADALKLITFDADGTLYADGEHFDQDNAMIAHIINLMRLNVHVGIVTAAGYPGEADKFERRLAGLLETFNALRLPHDITSRFHIMGGECNYLLRVTPDSKRLEFVPDHQWQSPCMLAWREEDIQAMLDGAQALLIEGAKRLNLGVQLIRKPRSVGIVPTQATIYEVLEDIALTVQNQLVARVPFCAFNGGNDVFVDAGNKSLGLQAMMSFTGALPHETLHVGDRFTLSGNDTATRDVCSVLWVANPEETGFFIKMLLRDIRKNRWQPYIE